jgi:hypothetical protein
MLFHIRSGLVLLSLSSIVVLPACSESDDAQSFEFDEEISRVIVDVDRGDIHISGDAEGPSTVDVLSTWRSTRDPDVDVWESDGTLHVKGDCPEVAVCDTEVYIDVPAGAELELDLRTGDLEIEGLDGDVIAEVTTGTVEGYDLGSDNVDVRTTTGSVDLRFTGGATDVMARVTTGNIDLTVPDRDYDVDVQVTTGDVDLRVDTAGDATARLFAKIITGDLTVRSN